MSFNSSSSTPSFTRGSSSGSSPAFLLVPSAPSAQTVPAARPRPSFPVSQAILHPPASPQRPATHHRATQAFKAPAHKHAHHLHSIPPREKSTRTLILDHMLWLHGRARFAQARSELGMGGVAAARADLGMESVANEPGPSTSAGAGDESNDNVDEGAAALGFGISRSERSKSSHNDDAEARFRYAVDLLSAGSFKARADGLDKVLSAMMDQPPEMNSFDSGSHSHLPNGVRLRLALEALVNDLFSRAYDQEGTWQDLEDEFHRTEGSRYPPSPPPDSPMSISSIVSNPADSASPSGPQAASAGHAQPSSDPCLHTYTRSLAALSSISSFTPQSAFSTEAPGSSNVTLPSLSNLQPRVSDRQAVAPPAGSIFSTIPRGAGPESPWALGSHLSQHPSAPSSSRAGGAFFPPAPPHGNARLPSPSSILQSHGSNGSYYQSPSRFTDYSSGGVASMTSRASPPTARTWRAVGHAKQLYDAGAALPRQRNPSNRKRCSRHLTLTCDCAMSRPRIAKSSIGAGLSKPRSMLRKLAPRYQPSGSQPTRRRYARVCRTAELLPRFLRLSALAAKELGREARGEEDTEDTDSVAGEKRSTASETDDEEEIIVGAAGYGHRNHTYGSSDGSADGDGARPARPTRRWYALLAGLVTRAVLEGYIMCGWKGSDGVEILMGLGMQAPKDSARSAAESSTPHVRTDIHSREDDERSDSEDDDDGVGTKTWLVDDDPALEPDEMPSLEEASRILFPRARPAGEGSGNTGWDGVESWVVGKTPQSNVSSRTSGPEEEYVREMTERVSEFLSVSSHSSTLLEHLEEIAERYPPEPVERAALRFCEAISEWRGMPELESSKNRAAAKQSPSPVSSISISSLINNPTETTPPKPRPAIDSYFTVSRTRGRIYSTSNASASPAQRKKARTSSWSENANGGNNSTIRARNIPRQHRPSIVEEHIPASWTGPYGI